MTNTPLAKVCEISMGQAPAGESYNDTGRGLPLIAGAGDIADGKIQVKKYTTAPTRMSKRGDIILGIRATIGVKAWADDVYCLGRGVAGLRPKPDLNPSYLWHWLSHARSQLERKGRGATFLQVNRADISDLEVPLPSVDEQRRIAAVLDQADDLRAKRQSSLLLVDSLNESVFLDMFGSVFAEHSGVELGELGRVVTGKTPPTSDPGLFGGLIPFVTPGDLDRQVDVPVARSLTEAGAAASRVVRRGAVLCCCIGATIGKTGIAHQDVAFNQQINAVEWGPQIADWYGYFAVRSLRPMVRALGASTTLPLLKKTAFARLRIPVPSIDRQREFGSIVEGIASMSVAPRRSLMELDELFSSLQHRAFSGQL